VGVHELNRLRGEIRADRSPVGTWRAISGKSGRFRALGGELGGASSERCDERENQQGKAACERGFVQHGG